MRRAFIIIIIIIIIIISIISIRYQPPVLRGVGFGNKHS